MRKVTIPPTPGTIASTVKLSLAAIIKSTFKLRVELALLIENALETLEVPKLSSPS